MNSLSLDKQLFIFLNEVIDRRVPISIIFSVVSILIITIGINWPKIYESRTSILWTNYDPASAILQQGVSRASRQARVSDQVEIAREIILSNKILDKLIVQAQLDVDQNSGLKLSKRQLEVLKGNFRSSIQIFNTGRRLIVISYRHPNSELAYLVVSIASEMFLQETRDVKNKTSQGAYDFINRQVLDYKNKLDNIDKRIIEFRKANVDLDSDTRVGVNSRVNNLKTIVRETKLELTEARVQKGSLEDQLVIERHKIEQKLLLEYRQASSAQRESVYADRLKALQSSLDSLRLSYTESYPDIIQIKDQIKNLKAQIAVEESEVSSNDSTTTDDINFDDITFIESALYVQLAGEVADAETLIQTLLARIEDSQNRLNGELERANKVNALESQLEEMTRDLDVTQSIYDDLLTRRENARVSLNLQLENQGSTFKIQEPAVVPIVPVGLRFLHFVLGSVPLGLMIPLGILFGLLFIDTRVRHEDNIDQEVLQIPVIGTIEHYSNESDNKIELKKTMVSITVFVSSLLVISLLVILKINQFIGV